MAGYSPAALLPGVIARARDPFHIKGNAAGALGEGREFMARTDTIVLGAGIVGVSVALQLAKRGASVALIDRWGIGEQTSYGNSGVIEASTVLPPAFPFDIGSLLKVAFKRAGDANYHLTFLPWVAPWLLAFRANSWPERLAETARLNRPLFARALEEHEAFMQESNATRYLRKTGWIKLYRSERKFDALKAEFELAGEFGLPFETLDAAAAQALEPSLNPAFARGVFWPKAASISNPLAVTQAYVARFRALGGVTLSGDARTLHRSGRGWRVETNEGGVDAPEVVVALGPWAPDVLRPLGLRLPMAVKRGYHRHFKAQGNAALSRPVVDVEWGYLITPMEQGIRLTTGAEFAARDARPTPVQFDRVVPHAREIFPLGERADDKTWLGARPCFADSRPVIGRAPNLPGVWLAIGHAHWGLTLGPITGRLIGEMMAGGETFCDPTPYAAERFL
jgi:D-amino-acid dehydrogenase